MALASVNVWTGVQKLLFHFHLPPLTFPTEGMCAECLKSCLTLFNPTDCSPPGSSALGPWDSPGKNTGVGSCALLQGIFPTQGLNPGLLPWQVGSFPLSRLQQKDFVKLTHIVLRVRTSPICIPVW